MTCGFAAVSHFSPDVLFLGVAFSSCMTMALLIAHCLNFHVICLLRISTSLNDNVTTFRSVKHTCVCDFYVFAVFLIILAMVNYEQTFMHVSCVFLYNCVHLSTKLCAVTRFLLYMHVSVVYWTFPVFTVVLR